MLTFLTSTSVAGEKRYYYCSLRDTHQHTVYYSDVFPVNYKPGLHIDRAFEDYLHSMYENVYGHAGCRGYASSESEAHAGQDEERSLDRRAMFQHLIDTHWTYTEDH